MTDHLVAPNFRGIDSDDLATWLLFYLESHDAIITVTPTQNIHVDLNTMRGTTADVVGRWAPVITNVALKTRLATLRHQTATDDTRGALDATLRGRLSEWRSLLTQNPIESRGVLELLLAGPIVVTPQPDTSPKAPVFDVRIPLTIRGLFEGQVCPKGVASPEGFALTGQGPVRLKLGGILQVAA